MKQVAAELKPYIPCPGCDGTGIGIVVDEDTKKRKGFGHGRCNGAGILILSGTYKGKPSYRAPKI
jgi:hypothetical protein